MSPRDLRDEHPTRDQVFWTSGPYPSDEPPALLAQEMNRAASKPVGAKPRNILHEGVFNLDAFKSRSFDQAAEFAAQLKAAIEEAGVRISVSREQNPYAAFDAEWDAEHGIAPDPNHHTIIGMPVAYQTLLDPEEGNYFVDTSAQAKIALELAKILNFDIERAPQPVIRRKPTGVTCEAA